MKSVLRKSKTLYRSYHCLRLLRELKHRERYLRHQAELFRGEPDLERLSQQALKELAWQREIFSINEVYATDLALKKFLGVHPGKPLKSIVEHGCVMNGALVENHLAFPLARQNIVMSRVRSQFLATKGVSATAIGPYIHYSDTVLNDADLAQLKKELGRTLLFFPFHSTQDVCLEESYRDLNAMLDEVLCAHHFDTVLICGYYLDIKQGLFEHIEKRANFRFVSCGHRMGPAFLALLKTYLLLADVVASNSIGTQTGYAIYYGKPFWVIGRHDVRSFFKGDPKSVALEKKAAAQPMLGRHELSFEEFEDMLRPQENAVSAEVRACVQELWGFDDVKDREGLYQAVLS